MSVRRAIRRFLSSWLAFVLVVGPALTFFLDFVLGTTVGIEWGVQVAVALAFAVGFLRRGCSLDFLWSYVKMLWTGFLLYVFGLLVVVGGVALVFGVTPARPSELDLEYRLVIGVLGGIAYLHLYRSAYRKAVAERDAPS